MPYITDKDNQIQFIVTITCNKCCGTHCDHYVAELSPNPRESDLAIRYRCHTCGNTADGEG